MTERSSSMSSCFGDADFKRRHPLKAKMSKTREVTPTPTPPTTVIQSLSREIVWSVTLDTSGHSDMS
jgi:hypothetical protein